VYGLNSSLYLESTCFSERRNYTKSLTGVDFNHGPSKPLRDLYRMIRQLCIYVSLLGVRVDWAVGLGVPNVS
jgi:hypothetical protein